MNMKKWIGAVLLVTIILVGCLILFSKKEQPLFNEEHAIIGSLQLTIAATGIVEPRNRLEIKPPIAGRVEDILVNEGEQVKKGQVLAWMSSTERAALLDAARAKGQEELAHWEEYYRPTPIVAPIDGMIILRSVEPGQSFTVQEAILVMSDKLSIKAQVDETDMGMIKLGQNVTIVIDAFSEQPFKGKVRHMAYEATSVNNVTSYEIDIAPISAPSFIRSGMSANVTFEISGAKQAVLVPSAAVIYQNGETIIQVRGAKGTIEQRKVVVGNMSQGSTVVISGVAAGETVLVPRLESQEMQESVNPFGPPSRRKRGMK